MRAAEVDVAASSENQARARYRPRQTNRAQADDGYTLEFLPTQDNMGTVADAPRSTHAAESVHTETPGKVDVFNEHESIVKDTGGYLSRRGFC